LLLLAVGLGVILLAALWRSNPPPSNGPATGGAAGLVGAAPAAGILTATTNGEEAARRTLIEKHAMTCFMAADVSVIIPREVILDLDRRIDTSGVTNGWVTKDVVWVGTAAEAAKGFGADAAFGDEQGVWVVRSDPVPHAFELQPLVTPGGRTVWSKVDGVQPCQLDNPAASNR
jgi:hypothetical protein